MVTSQCQMQWKRGYSVKTTKRLPVDSMNKNFGFLIKMSQCK